LRLFPGNIGGWIRLIKPNLRVEVDARGKALYFGRAMKIYVGNLPVDTTESELRELFAPFAELAEIDIKSHHRSGKPLQFALIRIAEESAAQAAIEALDHSELHGRPIRVMKAFGRPDLPTIPDADRSDD